MRASTTDPEARKMKMGDGGFRGAYNVQFVTGVTSRVIYSAGVTNTADPGTAPKMMQTVHARLNLLNMPPAKNWNVDAAYSSKAEIVDASLLYPNCNYNAAPKPRKNVDPKKHQPGDAEAVKKWRDSLDTPETKAAYKQRSSTAEFSNAQTKNHGMDTVMGRGSDKVEGEVHLHAIAQNFLRYRSLTRKKETSPVP